MNQSRPISWVGDPTDRRVNQIRQAFLRGLQDQSKSVINYYDFLLVAKKLNLRFEQSAHLMELRKFFFQHKNQLPHKKLIALLFIDQDCLNQVHPDRLPEKIIIRFRLDSKIQAIKQVTNEDDQYPSSDQDNLNPYAKSAEMNPLSRPKEEGQEYNQKLTIILSIKVTEMIKKIKILIDGTSLPYDSDQKNISLLTFFQDISFQNIPYELFRKGILNLLKKLEPQFTREKLTMSEDDIRAVFSVLDENNKGQISTNCFEILRDETATIRKITRFYQSRINKRMVKNTLFKLGKNSNSIQIYQVKNASVLEFKNIQDGLLEGMRSKEKIKNRMPHFGPIKGLALRQSPSKTAFSRETERHNHSSLGTYKGIGETNLDKEREKIDRIIRSSKSDKKNLGHDTIANKLRKLFIHKVILPREKLLEEEKQKYVQNRSGSSNMIVKLI